MNGKYIQTPNFCCFGHISWYRLTSPSPLIQQPPHLSASLLICLQNHVVLWVTSRFEEGAWVMYEEFPRVQILLVLFRKKSQRPGCYCAQTFVLLLRVELASGQLGSHLALLQPFRLNVLLGRWAGGAQGPRQPCTSHLDSHPPRTPSPDFGLSSSFHLSLWYKAERNTRIRGVHTAPIPWQLWLWWPPSHISVQNPQLAWLHLSCHSPRYFSSSQLSPLLLFNSCASGMAVTVLGALSVRRGTWK